MISGRLYGFLADIRRDFESRYQAYMADGEGRLAEMLRFALGTRASALIVLQIVIGLALSVGCFGLFYGLGDVVLQQELDALDTALSNAVYALRAPWLTRLMSVITLLGMDFIVVAGGLLVLYLVWKRHRAILIVFVMLVAFGSVLNALLKLIAQRPRPAIDPLVAEQFYSFPSGHAMNAFLFYATLAHLYHYFTGRRSAAVWVAALALVALIGFSRVYLGVHYPTDILGGYLAGFAWFVTVLVVEKTLRFILAYRQRDSAPRDESTD